MQGLAGPSGGNTSDDYYPLDAEAWLPILVRVDADGGTFNTTATAAILRLMGTSNRCVS
jgi:hypothetical protein